MASPCITRAHRVLRLMFPLSIAIACGVDRVHSEPPTIYRETFGFCTGSVGPVAADESGWLGLKSGMPKAKFGNLKVFSYGTPQIGGSVNSGPRGLSQGYSFWFKPTYGLTVLTREFRFDAGLLSDPTTVIEYDQRLSGINMSFEPNRTQLAFLIDGVWYISEQGTAQRNGGIAWEKVAVFPAGLRYGTVTTVGDVGPQVPISYGVELPPSGTVQAFGVFLGEVNGRVRIENFTIKALPSSGAPIATDIQQPTLNLCPASSPDRDGIAPPISTPGSGDNDGGGEDNGGGPPDQQVPDETPPPQLTPVAKNYFFCTEKEQGEGRGIKIPARSRRALLKLPSKATAIDLRDRAIMAVLAQRLMPIGALVNTRVGQYNATTTSLTISLRRGAAPTVLTLRGAAKSALASYVTGAGLGGDLSAPLFVSANMKAKLLDTSRTACLRELRSLVVRRARLAKIGSKGLFVSAR